LTNEPNLVSLLIAERDKLDLAIKLLSRPSQPEANLWTPERRKAHGLKMKAWHKAQKKTMAATA